MNQKTGLLAAAAAAAAITLAACGSTTSSSSSSAPASSAPASAAAAAATASATPSGSPQYITDMRTAFSFGSGVSDSDITNFGLLACTDLQSGKNVAQEVQVAQSSWSNTSAGEAIRMITLASQDMCPAQQAAQTVTYIVTGTNGGAQVAYGPAGSEMTGSVPMHLTQPLANPSYYSISAQLQGYGDVTCKIRVDGVTIATGTASGGYNIASCEIGQNATTGSWQDDNSG